MAIIAVSAVALAILVGTLVLADLAPSPPLRRWVGGHVGLGLAAGVVVSVAAFGGQQAMAWLGLGVVAATIGAGVRLYAMAREQTPDAAVGGSAPASRGVSPGLLVVHGAAAGAAALLVLLAALRV